MQGLVRQAESGGGLRYDARFACGFRAQAMVDGCGHDRRLLGSV
jgi:hypothetical protein